MDPYVTAEQPDSQTTDDGASYLRRLKEQPGEEPSSTPANVSPLAAAPQNSVPEKDRRRSPRFKCAGGAEFTAEDSNVRMWGTLTDISLRGCYVEMSTTFPVDTKVELVLEAVGIRSGHGSHLVPDAGHGNSHNGDRTRPKIASGATPVRAGQDHQPFAARSYAAQQRQ